MIPISVVMSVYNDARYLRESIDSILNQTFADFEFIITDDGSTDGISNILDEYEKKDSRVKIIHQGNIGLTKSLNNMIGISRGDFIARQDADDISHPERLKRQVEFLMSNKDILLVGSSGWIINEKGEKIQRITLINNPSAIKKRLLRENCFIHGSIMFRKKHNGIEVRYNEKMYFGQDYELFLRLSENFFLININIPLYYLRDKSDSVSLEHWEEQYIYGCVARKIALERRKGEGALLEVDELYKTLSENLKLKKRAKWGLDMQRGIRAYYKKDWKRACLFFYHSIFKLPFYLLAYIWFFKTLVMITLSFMFTDRRKT